MPLSAKSKLLTRETVDRLEQSIFDALDIATGDELREFCDVVDAMEDERVALKEALFAASDRYLNLLDFLYNRCKPVRRECAERKLANTPDADALG